RGRPGSRPPSSPGHGRGDPRGDVPSAGRGRLRRSLGRVGRRERRRRQDDDLPALSDEARPGHRGTPDGAAVPGRAPARDGHQVGASGGRPGHLPRDGGQRRDPNPRLAARRGQSRAGPPGAVPGAPARAAARLRTGTARARDRARGGPSGHRSARRHGDDGRRDLRPPRDPRPGDERCVARRADRPRLGCDPRAVVTRPIRIGVQLPEVEREVRWPELLDMARAVDEIAGGRFVLGLGAGWNETEFRAFGFPFDQRVARFEEAFTIIRTLLQEGAVDFEGRFYQARDCELLPRPRPGGPPLLIGSNGPRMLRIAVPHADAWNTWYVDTQNTTAGVAPLNAIVDEACRDVGRDPAEIRRTVAVHVRLPGGTGRTMGNDATASRIAPVEGSPEAMAEELRAYAAAGVH